MRHLLPIVSLVGALAAAAAVACTSSSGDVSAGDDGGTGDDGSSTLPPGSGTTTPTGPAGSGLNTGLPCDVQAVLENRCIACHDGKTAVSMLTYADLMKKSSVDPTKTIAQESLARMQDGSMPPAPAAPPEPDEIQVFADWVKAGTPENTMSCTDAPPGTDGGVEAGAILDAGDGGTVCTSNTFWTTANGSGPDMRPGEACNACHQIQGGPNLRIAGTVYPTPHEPDDCNGSKPPPQLTIVITDKNGKVTNLASSTVGNFQTAAKGIAPPFRATVTDGTKSRSMVGSVTSGDCNSCHTVTGKNGAPGRIVAP